MQIKKHKIIIREKDQLGLSQSDLNEPEDPMEHLLLDVMFDLVKIRESRKTTD